MTTTSSPQLVGADHHVPAAAGAPSATRVFAAMLHRDVTVGARELPSALAQLILQPVILLFIFGKVLPELGYARPGYVDVLFPGTVAMSVVLTGLQSMALPLVLEFSYSMEIEDRLLAPINLNLVALEKVLFAALRAVVAGMVMFPIGWLMLGDLPGTAGDIPLVTLEIVLGALVGSLLGLVLGTLISPNRIRLMFSLILTPLIFAGSCQYPWPALDRLRWFQVLTVFNPLTHVSEGMRAALTPDVPHIEPVLSLGALVAFIVALTFVGLEGFRRRALN
jgi:ABC-2 type transport system permease protein